MISAGFEDRPAYIPGPNGYYKLDPCIVESVNIECMCLDHFSQRGGLRSNSIQVAQDHTITLRAGTLEEIEDPFYQESLEAVLSLDNYSNLDLLKELEKRTKTDS